MNCGGRGFELGRDFEVFPTGPYVGSVCFTEYSKHKTPQQITTRPTMATGNNIGQTVSDTARRLAASPWPIYLCRLPTHLLPRKLQNIPPTESVPTSFQHWPAFVYDDVKDLLKMLPAKDHDVVTRHQQQEYISHPESRTKFVRDSCFGVSMAERNLVWVDQA